MELLHRDSFACSLVNQYIGASSYKPVYNAVLKDLIHHQLCVSQWCLCYDTEIQDNGEILWRSCANYHTLKRHMQGQYEPVLEYIELYNLLVISEGLGGVCRI
jgi:hypothetical protein